jgi:hypothetical protein
MAEIPKSYFSGKAAYFPIFVWIALPHSEYLAERYEGSARSPDLRTRQLSWNSDHPGVPSLERAEEERDAATCKTNVKLQPPAPGTC